MNELIKIRTSDEGKKLVSARELYDGLGMDKKNCSKWLNKNIKENDFFNENTDWVIVQMTTTEKGGRPTEDYAISLEFAKHLAMMSRTEKSHEYRNYFIECEKVALETIQPKLPQTYKEALLELVATIEKNEKLEEENKLLESEVEHKEDVIIGLVDNIDLAEKKQRISQIIRHNAKGRFQERYNLLYFEFDKKYHIDSKKRMENAKERKEIKKSINRMGYICDYMGKTSELYEISCKLFENEVEQLKNEIWEVVA